jgi:hypothetical protein
MMGLSVGRCLELLLDPAPFDREFRPELIALGDDLVHGKRKLHFEAPRR